MISNRQTEESNKMDFSEHVSTEKERLLKERDEAAKTLAETTERLQTLERQLEAIDAYESIMGPSAKAAKAKAAPPKRKRAARGRRNSNRSAAVLEAIQNAPQGIDRAGIIEALNVKGDKSAEQAVSNLLSRLKKTGQVSHEGRIYSWAETAE